MASDFEIQVDDAELQRELQTLDARIRDMTPAYQVIGETLKTSVIRNFEEGGRYGEVGDWRGGKNRWQPLSPVTIARITKGTGDMGHRKILVGEGHLLNSIHWQADSEGVAVGSNLIYAAIHNFGGMAGRGHKVSIPARPYLVVQDEDLREIKQIINDFLTGDLAA